MENYDWSDFRDFPFSERFPQFWSDSASIMGFDFWINFSSNPERWAPALFYELLPELRSFDEKLAAIGNRRVFISHRQCDLAEARNVANVVKRLGWNYWLDVEDPLLQGLSAHIPARSPSYALAVAAVIEFALLNCSHVISVFTSNTSGSAWVPYEYGRIKPKFPSSPTAMCRTFVGIPHNGLPEYYYLNPICQDDTALEKCLRGVCA